MTSTQETQISLPTDLVQQLEKQAKDMGLSLSSYLRFVATVKVRQHDAEFMDAAKYVFSKYPNALRKLAQ